MKEIGELVLASNMEQLSNPVIIEEKSHSRMKREHIHYR